MTTSRRLAAAAIALAYLPILLTPSCNRSDQPESLAGPAASHAVGFRIFQWNYQADDGSSKLLTAAVWYPTRSDAATTTYANGTVGQAAANAPANTAAGPFPLIVWSHGYTGSGLTSAYLCEYLAGHGYVVAACDHDDAFNRERITGAEALSSRQVRDRQRDAVADLLAELPGLNHAKYAYRPTDLAQLIDRMLAENADENSPLAGMVDADRIGAGGYSMGGYTTLVLIGCLPDRLDDRIKVAVLHSPAAWMWRSEDYQRIAVPVLYMLGEKEGENREPKLLDTLLAVANTPPPSWYLEIAEGHHLTFADLRAMPAAIRWPDQSASIARYTLAMFDRFLADDEATRADADDALSQGDDWTSTFEANPGP